MKTRRRFLFVLISAATVLTFCIWKSKSLLAKFETFDKQIEVEVENKGLSTKPLLFPIDWNEWDEDKAIEDYIAKIVNEVEGYTRSPQYLDELRRLTEQEIGIIIRESLKSKFKLEEEQESNTIGDNFTKVPFDFEFRVRQDPTPDDQPWTELETHRIVKSDTDYTSRENATIFTLCRNEDLYSILSSIEQFETRFNSKYHYDWVFLNDQPFTDEFVEVTSNLVSGKARYGIIPPEHWSFPQYLDYEKAEKLWKSQTWSSVIYGSSESYRHMCRFNSMFFYKHPILLEYKYYWRIEPDVKFQCDVEYDPFKFMRENGKKYGFNLSMKELPITIETLWREIRSFFRKLDHDYFDPAINDNFAKFISDDNGVSYNNCHFWTNFEIADFDIFRNELYERYVIHLDRSGGFFYERWGDAPVHSIIFSLILNRNEIHLFQDISYSHSIAASCPIDLEVYKREKCSCDRFETWVTDENNCNNIYYDIKKEERPKDLDTHINSINSMIYDKYMDREIQKTERLKKWKELSKARRKSIQEARQRKMNKYLNEFNDV